MSYLIWPRRGMIKMKATDWVVSRGWSLHESTHANGSYPLPLSSVRKIGDFARRPRINLGIAVSPSEERNVSFYTFVAI